MSECIECPNGSKLCGEGVTPEDCEGDGGFVTLADGTKCPKNYVFHRKVIDEDGSPNRKAQYLAVFKNCTKEWYLYLPWSEKYRKCPDCD